MSSQIVLLTMTQVASLSHKVVLQPNQPYDLNLWDKDLKKTMQIWHLHDHEQSYLRWLWEAT